MKSCVSSEEGIKKGTAIEIVSTESYISVTFYIKVSVTFFLFCRNYKRHYFNNHYYTGGTFDSDLLFLCGDWKKVQ